MRGEGGQMFVDLSRSEKYQADIAPSDADDETPEEATDDEEADKEADILKV